MRTLYSLFLFLAPAAVFALECMPTTLSIQSSFNSGGPAFLNWTLVDADGTTEGNGMAQFNAETTSSLADVCLSAGCYVFTAVTGDPIQPFSVFLGIDAQGGFANEYDIEVSGSTMIVTFCLVENGPCTLEAEVVDTGTCWLIAVQITDANPNATFSWFINNQLIEVDNVNNVLNYEAPAPGSYEVCIAYETPDCPEGVVWCETVEVTQQCFDDAICPIIFDYSIDGCDVLLYLSGASFGDTFFYVNNEQVNNGESIFTYTLPYESSGVSISYEFCAEYVGGGICAGETWCFTQLVNSCVDCGIAIDYEEDECGEFVFTATVPSGWQDVVWTQNGESFGLLSWVQQLALEDGSHEICATFETPSCGLVQACVTVIVSCNSGGDPCDVTYEVNQTGCGEYTATLTQAPQGVPVYLFYLGQPILFMNDQVVLDIEVSEEYELCLFLESDACPEGVYECEDVFLFGCECPDELNFDLNDCVCDFSLSGLLSGSGATWTVNGLAVGGTSWDLTYEFATDGMYEVCATSTNVACQNFTLCVTVEVNNCSTCSPLELEVTGNPGALTSELILQAFLSNLNIDAEFDVLYTELTGALGIQTCLPDGCYELDLTLPEAFLDGLEVTVSVDNQIVIEHTFDAESPTLNGAIGINDEDCGTGVNNASSGSLMKVYPVPANALVTVELPVSGQIHVDVFDLAGRMVHNESPYVNERFMIDVTAFATGLYILQVLTEEGHFSARIQVNR